MSNLCNRPIYQKGITAVSLAQPKKARANAKGKPCTLRLACCNQNPETTVLAHLRMFGWAGTAQKPGDYLAVFGCSDCHDAVDGRNGTKSSDLWSFEDILRALGETLQIQFQDGVFKQ